MFPFQTACRTGKDGVMDVSEAIRTAKDYVKRVFQDDGIADVGLEEVEYDPAHDTWAITVGFARARASSENSLAQLLEIASANRVYKVVTLANADGHPLSVKNRAQ
jgi:hypothetical protein